MIRQLVVGNYKSLGPDVEIDFGPASTGLTVFVGRNGAGKSNVLNAVRFMSEAVRMGLGLAVAEHQGFAALRRWSGGHPHDVHLQIQVEVADMIWNWGLLLTADDRSDFRVKAEWALGAPHPTQEAIATRVQEIREAKGMLPGIELDESALWQEAMLEFESNQIEFFVRDGAWQIPTISPMAIPPPAHGLTLPEIAKLDVRYAGLVEALRNIAVYSLFPNVLRTPQNPDPTRPMRRQGENWAATLKMMEASDAKSEILAALSRVVGDIDDFRVISAGGFLIPEFRHGKAKRRERWFGAVQESDGTLRMAAILTALLQTPPPSLLGIEEPELAVHTGALPLLMDYFLQASSQMRVLVTTHSAEVLDLVPPDCLRVVERIDGTTVVRRLEPQQRESVRAHLATPSELLRLEGLRAGPADG